MVLFITSYNLAGGLVGSNNEVKAMTKATRNSLNKMFDLIIKVPYNKLQYVLNDNDIEYYNSGLYGWNYDVYTFKFAGFRVALSTGYRPIGDDLFEQWNYDLIEQVAKQDILKGKELFRGILYRHISDWVTLKYTLNEFEEKLYN